MSELVGSDIERLWNWLSRSIQNRLKINSFQFRVVLFRIRPIPTLISKIKWLWSGLPLMCDPYISFDTRTGLLIQMNQILLIVRRYRSVVVGHPRPGSTACQNKATCRKTKNHYSKASKQSKLTNCIIFRLFLFTWDLGLELGIFGQGHFRKIRVVQTQAILLMKLMSERVGSDIERLGIEMTWSSVDFESI